MKFGKTLKRILHLPWSDYYVEYKQLKQHVKRCRALLELMLEKISANSTADSTRSEGLHRLEFFEMVALEARKVSNFYSSRLNEWEAIYDTLSKSSADIDNVSRLDALRQLCDQCDKLRSFVLLNHLAFIKILKKYDKHVSTFAQSAVGSMPNGYSFLPIDEVGSASIVCMEVIMQHDFYSSPRLANLITQLQVAVATLHMIPNTQDEKTMESNAPTSPASLDDNDFACPICLDVLTLPVVLSCSHRFCFSCLASWSTQSQKCPVCRLEHPLHPDSYQVNSTLDDFLKKNFPVRHRLTDADAIQSRPQTNDNTAPTREETVMQTSSGEFDTDKKHAQEKFLCEELKLPKSMFKSLVPNIVNPLKHINSLLDVAEPTAYYIFDVDDTLITNLYTPCLLTTDRGIQAYQAILQRNPLYSELSLKVRNNVTRILQRALDSKRLVEPDTQVIVKRLQDMGCHVFGLTKRWSESNGDTRRELLTMGMDFSLSSPFPKGRKYCDEFTEALLIDGVIYTNGHDKGPVLDRFMSQILFPPDVRAMNEKKTCDNSSSSTSANHLQLSSTSSASSSSASSASTSSLHSFASMFISTLSPFQNKQIVPSTSTLNPTLPNITPNTISSSKLCLPSKVVFVDDLHENALSVVSNLTLCTELSIPIFSCHYTAVRDQTESAQRESESELRANATEDDALELILHNDMEIVQYQVYHLVHNSQIVNDQQARIFITRLKKKAAEEQQRIAEERSRSERNSNEPSSENLTDMELEVS